MNNNCVTKIVLGQTAVITQTVVHIKVVLALITKFYFYIQISYQEQEKYTVSFLKTHI